MVNFKNKYKMIEHNIKLSEKEIKDLKEIRNYFVKHDKTIFEHKAYDILNNLIKRI